jgi:hypothetical protein
MYKSRKDDGVFVVQVPLGAAILDSHCDETKNIYRKTLLANSQFTYEYGLLWRREEKVFSLISVTCHKPRVIHINL